MFTRQHCARVIFSIAILVFFVTSACLPSHPGDPSDARLASIRTCESHGNYGAVSASGTYRGAYQFSRSTWNRVAAKWFPSAVGQDPAAAPGWLQDYLAKACWRMGGASQWPICGYR